MGNVVTVVESRIPQELVTMGYLSAMLSLHHLPLSLLQVLPYFFIAINPTLSLSSLSLSNIFSIYAYTLFKLFHHTIMEQLTKLVKLFFILLAFTFASQLMQGHTHANAIFFLFHIFISSFVLMLYLSVLFISFFFICYQFILMIFSY